MVSDSSDLHHTGVTSVALTLLLIIRALNLYSDIVCDISRFDLYGPDKCGSNKCSLNIVTNMVSDNGNYN